MLALIISEVGLVDDLVFTGIGTPSAILVIMEVKTRLEIVMVGVGTANCFERGYEISLLVSLLGLLQLHWGVYAV